MRIVGLGAMLAVLAMPSAAWAQNDPELACVYRGAAAEDALILYAMGRRAVPEDEREDEAMNRLADQVGRCQAQHGWTDTEAMAAIQYALGRAAYEDTAATLAARGFASGFLELVVADLGEQGMTMLRSGDDRPENLDFVGGIVSRRIEESGAYVADRADLMNVGRIVARGVVAASVRDRGAAAFRSR